MPQVGVTELPDCDEVKLTIRFDPRIPIEVAFQRVFVSSFQPDTQKRLLEQGSSAVCVDCNVEDNIVTITGRAEDINSRLHAPPMVIPANIASDPVQLSAFWKTAGDVIYEQGQLNRYRERDRAISDQQYRRTPEHQHLSEQVALNLQQLNQARMLRELITAIKAHDLMQFNTEAGPGIMLLSGAKVYTASDLKKLLLMIMSDPAWQDPAFHEAFRTQIGTIIEQESSTTAMLRQLGGKSKVVFSPEEVEQSISEPVADEAEEKSVEDTNDTAEESKRDPNAPLSLKR